MFLASDYSDMYVLTFPSLLPRQAYHKLKTASFFFRKGFTFFMHSLSIFSGKNFLNALMQHGKLSLFPRTVSEIFMFLKQIACMYSVWTKRFAHSETIFSISFYVSHERVHFFQHGFEKHKVSKNCCPSWGCKMISKNCNTIWPKS